MHHLILGSLEAEPWMRTLVEASMRVSSGETGEGMREAERDRDETEQTCSF